MVISLNEKMQLQFCNIYGPQRQWNESILSVDENKMFDIWDVREKTADIYNNWTIPRSNPLINGLVK